MDDMSWAGIRYGIFYGLLEAPDACLQQADLISAARCKKFCEALLYVDNSGELFLKLALRHYDVVVWGFV